MSRLEGYNTPWCAIAHYPGKEKRFRVGTVWLPANAQSHEIEAALVEHVLTFLPSGFVIIEQQCGEMVWSPREAT